MNQQEYLKNAIQLEKNGYPMDWKQVAFHIADVGAAKVAELEARIVKLEHDEPDREAKAEAVPDKTIPKRS